MSPSARVPHRLRVGVRQWLGDIILFTFLSGSCCLFLIHCWLWWVVPVSSVVLGRTGGPKGPLSVCRAKPENRGRGLCQHFEHVTVPAGEAEKIMEADNAANVSGFSRARAMRVMPGSVLTALNPESLGITDMSVYGKSGKPLAPVVAGTRFDATASAEKRRVSTVSPLMGRFKMRKRGTVLCARC